MELLYMLWVFFDEERKEYKGQWIQIRIHYTIQNIYYIIPTLLNGDAG